VISSPSTPPPPSIEALFTPADFQALALRDLSNATCVVFDVLRATTTLLTALAAGAESVTPAATVAEALALRRADPDVLLAGERDGVRITAVVSGGVDFDLGNSPREFTPHVVAGRRIVATTTNGTRALRACAGARHVLPASLRNISAVARWIILHPTPECLLVCSGTYEDAAYEDVVGAGALVRRLAAALPAATLLDSACIAEIIYGAALPNLAASLSTLARNGRRLAAMPELAPDVALCAAEDDLDVVAVMGCTGAIRRVEGSDVE